MARTTRMLATTLCAAVVTLGTAVPAQAATPKNMFVMARDLADIITMDPAEVFELATGEIMTNLYDRVMMFEPEDLQELTGGVTESYAVSEDGKTITFKLRDGLTFHSGNPVRPEDVEFSLERVVKLKKTPSFIVTQFGWNADNVDDLIEVVDDRHVRVTIVEEFSPGLVLNALSAGGRVGGRQGARALPRGGRRSRLRVAEDEQRGLRRVQPEELEGQRDGHAGRQSRLPPRRARG